MIKNFKDIYNFDKKIALKSETDTISFANLYSYSKKLSKIFNHNCLVVVVTDNKIELIALYLILLTFKCKIMLISKEYSKFNELIKNFKPSFIINVPIKSSDYLDYGVFKKIKICKRITPIKYKINRYIKILIATSGTTGDSKFVKLSKSNLLHNANGIIKSLIINKESYPITTMPLSYSYGLSIINSHIFSGNKVFVNNYNIFDNNFWKNIRKFKITTFGGVPIFYEMLLKSKFIELKNTTIKYLTQAGGSIDPYILNNLFNILKEKSIKLFIMYGQTESTARISVKFLDDPNDISIGNPIKGTKLLIKGNDIKNFNRNLKGEILIKSKSIFKGYATNYKDLKNIDNIKILKTGDIGHYEPNNGVKIIGRIKRIAKIYGNRVNLDSIEKLFAKVNKQVFIKTDDKLLYIYSLNLKKFEIESVFKNNNILIPFKFIKLKLIPTKSNGKVDYSKLK